MRTSILLLLSAAAMFVAGVLAAGWITSAAAVTMAVGLLVGGLMGAVAGRLLIGHVDAPASSRSEVDGWRELSRELERSRRHERPFAMLRLPAPRDGTDDAEAWCNETAGQIAGALRQGDTVWSSANAVWVLMPESDKSQATQTLARVVRSVPDHPLAAAASLVSFPDDAITGIALRRTLESPASVAGDYLTPPVATAESDGG